MLSDCPDQESAATSKRYREFALGYGCLSVTVGSRIHQVHSDTNLGVYASFGEPSYD